MRRLNLNLQRCKPCGPATASDLHRVDSRYLSPTRIAIATNNSYREMKPQDILRIILEKKLGVKYRAKGPDRPYLLNINIGNISRCRPDESYFVSEFTTVEELIILRKNEFRVFVLQPSGKSRLELPYFFFDGSFIVDPERISNLEDLASMDRDLSTIADHILRLGPCGDSRNTDEVIIDDLTKTRYLVDNNFSIFDPRVLVEI